jgi:hypothetical protein
MRYSYPDSLSAHLWQASGQPPPQWPVAAIDDGLCATCGVRTGERGVATSTMLTSTFSRHADFLRFGENLCVPCAWMYSDPKRHHRSVLVIGDRIWWPVLGMESATDERPHWGDLVMGVLAEAGPDAAVSGVVTTDPKPRLWPLARMTTAARPGLYVHAPDADLSAFVAFDRAQLVTVVEAVERALRMGFTKRACRRGLMHDKRFSADLTAGMQAEAALSPLRSLPAFPLGVLVARKVAS